MNNCWWTYRLGYRDEAGNLVMGEERSLAVALAEELATEAQEASWQ
jgi:hypothetical protein